MLLEYFWWGSVFLINVPIVLAVFPFAQALIPRGEGNKQRPCDFAGSALVMAGLVGVIYALKELSQINSSWLVIMGSAAAGVLFLGLFVRRQKRAVQPMIDFSLFRNRAFACGVGVAITSMIALIGIELVLSQRLQLVLGLTPFMAAMFILPIPVASALASPLAGMLIPRVGVRKMMLGGFAISALGIVIHALVYDGSAVIQLISLFILGFGLGGAVTAASTSIMLNAPEDKAGMVAAIEDVSWEMGGVLGVTLLGGLMTAVYSRSLTLPQGLVSGETAYDSLDEALTLAGHLSPEHASLLTSLARTAFDQAFLAVLISAAVLVITSVVVLKIVLRKSVGTRQAS
ncbi:Methyl viologen resistance protein SmvA [Rahnella aquatilis]|nr:Methyl viologen resistance protein SmvA [Rahnella aquatilis]